MRSITRSRVAHANLTKIATFGRQTTRNHRWNRINFKKSSPQDPDDQVLDRIVRVLDKDLNGKKIYLLSFRIRGLEPIQAEGHVDGIWFFFHARNSKWTFLLSRNPEKDPRALSPKLPPNLEEDADLFFQTKETLRGQAGHMPYDEVERIIRSCVEKYLQSQAS